MATSLKTLPRDHPRRIVSPDNQNIVIAIPTHFVKQWEINLMCFLGPFSFALLSVKDGLKQSLFVTHSIQCIWTTSFQYTHTFQRKLLFVNIFSSIPIVLYSYYQFTTCNISARNDPFPSFTARSFSLPFSSFISYFYWTTLSFQFYSIVCHVFVYDSHLDTRDNNSKQSKLCITCPPLRRFMLHPTVSGSGSPVIAAS